MVQKIISLTSISALFFLLLAHPIQGQVKDILNKAKDSATSLKKNPEDNIGAGLKEALNFGVEAAVTSLSAEGGYINSLYKIHLPEEANTIIQKVKLVPGFEDVEIKLIQKMNEAASLAAQKATPIFLSAIKNMTIQDAMSILKGQENAATTYLDKSTRQSLTNEFLPIIQESLDAVQARAYWSSVMNAYNKIPLVKKVNPELDRHVNNKALDGLYGLIAVKEKGIRNDASQRTTDLLRKVFGN